jgi:hypothetical protein
LEEKIMKIRILQFVAREEIGALTDLKVGDIVAMDAEVCEPLIEAEKAEEIF